LSLERHLTKDKLLELYLNEVYLGQEGSVALHGVPEAGQAFFGKAVADLSIDEAALLAGIIKAPSSYAPRKHVERALERRNTVLAKMRELRFITDAEYAVAVKKPVKVSPQRAYRRVAPYFVTALEAELSQSIDLEAAQAAGLAVYTGLDLGLQECGEVAVRQGLENLERTHSRLSKKGRRLEAALVAIEPYSGLIKTYVGGRDFSTSQFDRVSQGMRQIGSTVKPFLYLSALDGSLNSYKVASPVSILEDRPQAITIKHQATWAPENYDKDYRGDVTLRYALENSLNLPAIYVAERVGIPTVKRALELFGLAEKVPAVPALALGALDTTLMRVTAAYGTLANGGVYIQPRLFVTAVSGQGDRLSTADIRETRVAEDSAVYVLTNIMQGVLARGTGKAARAAGFQRDAAGKTGTSDKSRDAWFIGFTPNLVVGVWLGYDDNSPVGITGGSAAAPMWGAFMQCAAPFFADVSFVKPRGVAVVDIDATTRELATTACPPDARVREVFVSGTEPERKCRTHGEGSAAPYSLRDSEAAQPRDRRRPADRSFWDTIFG
jgi:penicillin-binding protein 1B